jgi:hypothetical protein
MSYTFGMSLQTELASLFQKDLSTLQQQIDAFSSEELLWMTLPGVTNSAGNLALHLEGNLREYIGRQLGGQTYTRDRPLEFSAKGIPKAELVARLKNLSVSIPPVVEHLSQVQLEAEYPQVVSEAHVSTQKFLIHLYAHLSWHLGQIDYLRRILAAGPAQQGKTAPVSSASS